ncbi:MAG: hypothetical protein KBF88_01495 [Polyangiaceae bacterium]|nr:hypothetical protein [Polyangiaceae bacterium]
MSRDPIVVARLRLTTQFGALCGLLLVAMGFGTYFYVRQALFSGFETTHALAVQSMLETVSAPSDAMTASTPIVNKREFQEEFEELNVTLGVIAVRVWTPEGQLLAEAGVDHSPVSYNGPSTEFRGAPAHLSIVRRQPFKGGLIAVTRRAGALAQDLETLWRALLFLVPFGFLASLLIGWIMAGRSLRPVTQAFAQQRAFMADAAHEFRTPLSILRTHAEVHLDGESDAEKSRAALGVIARASQQLSSMLDDLLYLSRSDAAALAPKKRAFDLEDLLEETLEGFQPLAAKAGVEIELVRSGPMKLQGDPSQIARLFGILIDNALRHGNEGRLDVRIERRRSQVLVSVEDGGPGISADLLPRVFDRFVRGEAAHERHAEGHGLGLSIAQSIVQSHGGSLVLSRNARGGTTAQISLPVD